MFHLYDPTLKTIAMSEIRRIDDFIFSTDSSKREKETTKKAFV